MATPRIPHPANFEFGRPDGENRLSFGARGADIRVRRTAANVHHVELVGPEWSPSPSHVVLASADESTHTERGEFVLAMHEGGRLVVSSASGNTILAGHVEGSFGRCGDDWMLRLEAREGDRYYGLGEKWGSLEKTGQRTTFWNTDVWADFDGPAIARLECDPTYASIPYLVIKREGIYIGVLLDTAFPAFASVRSTFEFHRPDAADPELYLGARGGTPSVYVLVGPTMAELTMRLQRLVGTTPRPPLWALGHHQSRWGYGSANDLERLDSAFRRHDIPCDGLWLDIDYMDRFKVFSLDETKFPDAEKSLEKLAARGRRIVPILDPGVKVEPGYSVYDVGLEQGVFCTTDEGSPYVGIVWPGKVHFPDFATTEARKFWSRHVTELARRGFAGFWIDMNDPSTGGSDPQAMRFDRGRLPHAAYRNQYALGMARATFTGLAEAFPERRPFVLTRSASTSMSRYAAVWTGDNVSNEVHLAASIPTSLNLALSGIPFNGPDVPGFGDDATDDLMVRWYKAGFLFPFLRNHACQGTRLQEPWAFSKSTLATVRHFIRLRYKLMPYLYNLFIEQERTGEGILRPLFYDFESSNDFDFIDDQFMVGPALMQAPVLSSKDNKRTVVLPHVQWFDAIHGEWVEGGTSVKVRDKRRTTPLFVRGGSVVPMRRTIHEDVPRHLDDIELHVFLPPNDGSASASFRYEFDAGDGYEYRSGARSVIEGTFTRSGKRLSLTWDRIELGAGSCRVVVVTYSDEKKIEFENKGKQRQLYFRPKTWNMVGKKIDCQRSASFRVEPGAWT